MKIQAMISSLAFATATLGLNSIAMADEHDTISDEESTGQMDNTELFNQLDVNADGVISEDEAAAIPALGELEEQFDDLDQDNSGDLNQEEFQEYKPEGGSAF